MMSEWEYNGFGYGVLFYITDNMIAMTIIMKKAQVCRSSVCVFVWSESHFLCSGPHYNTSLCCHLIDTHKRSSPHFEADRVNENVNWCIDLTFCSEGCGVCVSVCEAFTCATVFHTINMSVKMTWISSSWTHLDSWCTLACVCVSVCIMHAGHITVSPQNNC